MGKRKESAVVRDLVTLTKASPKVRHLRVKHIPKDSMKLLCDCSRAVLKGEVPLSTPQKDRLRRYRKDLRKLASSETQTSDKRAILKKGGLLQALVQPKQ